jgi:hypothetical protein
MNDSPTTILKRDALGLIGYPHGQREALLNEFERSGLTENNKQPREEVDRLQQEKKVFAS